MQYIYNYNWLGGHETPSTSFNVSSLRKQAADITINGLNDIILI